MNHNLKKEYIMVMFKHSDNLCLNEDTYTVGEL